MYEVERTFIYKNDLKLIIYGIYGMFLLFNRKILCIRACARSLDTKKTRNRPERPLGTIWSGTDVATDIHMYQTAIYEKQLKSLHMVRSFCDISKVRTFFPLYVDLILKNRSMHIRL